ncbi:MAG: YfhO family protein [Lachnospiraceae bacterium]|nr:YfhO family protein [Lachnospiraceae bacterium]
MQNTGIYRIKGILKHIREYTRYLLPSCVTLVIYCIILSVKSIYPFGSNTIDYYDMAQQIAAFYYHVYDMLHGTKAYFYDWYSALGTNMAMSTSGCSNLSPFNLFFLFINRSSLLKSLSVFNGIKLMCMSFTMYFYLNKTHEKSPFFFKLAASVGYSFCGFVLVLYITNQWVDIAAMFPLIMYFYDRLIETGRIRGYVITLTITLVASYYLGFMILIFIFLYTGLKLTENLLDSATREAGNVERRDNGIRFTFGYKSKVSDMSMTEGDTVEDHTDHTSVDEEADRSTSMDETADKSTSVDEAADKRTSLNEKADKSMSVNEVAVKSSSDEKVSDKNVAGADLSDEGKSEDVPVDRAGIRKEMHLTRLGIGTFMSLALSAWILVPQIAQMLNSARFKNGNESEASGTVGRYLEIISHVRGDYTTRWWSLLGISFAVAIILTGMIKYRKDRRAILMTVSMIAMMVLELFFESINLIWHFGSYVQYPIRNGFIIYFIFAYLSCYYAARMYGIARLSEKKEEGCKADNDRSYMSFVITVICFLAFIGFYRNHIGMPIRRVFHITSGMMGAAFLYYMVILNIEEIRHLLSKAKPLKLSGIHGRAKDAAYATESNPDESTGEYNGDDPEKNAGIYREEDTGEKDGRFKEEKKCSSGYRWAVGVLVLEILCYGFLLFGKPDFITGYSEEPEQNGQYIYLCEQLKDKFGLENEFLYRVKNPDESLNANYGFVLMQPALSNWTHMIAPGEQEGAAAWGYSIQFTRLLDAGGTVFSDALIGVRKIISRVPMDERLYTELNRAEISVDPKTNETVTYYLYEPVYTLPFGEVLKNEADSDADVVPAKKNSEKKSSKKLYTAVDDKAVEQAITEQNTVKLHNLIYHSIVRARSTAEADKEGYNNDGTEYVGGKVGYDSDRLGYSGDTTGNVDGKVGYDIDEPGSDTRMTSNDTDVAVWYVKDNKPVIDDAEAYVDISASDKIVSSKIRVKGESALYVLGSGGDQEYANCTIEVGSRDDMHTVAVPTLGDYGNIYYPAHFNNNSVYIGSYKDETVEVRITMDGDRGEYFDAGIMGVSLDAMKMLCVGNRAADDARVKATGNGLTLDASVSKDVGNYVNRLLLPVTYDKGFGISVNGKRAEGSSYAGLFTVISLEEGDNTVSMRFIPPGMIVGIVITLLTAALILAYSIIRHIKMESLQELMTEPESRIEPVLVRLYVFAFAAVVLFVYIIPVVYGLFILISGR